MSSQTLIVNEKGLFANGTPVVFVTQKEIDNIKKTISKTKTSNQEQEILTWGMTVLESLPLMKGRTLESLSTYERDEYRGRGFFHVASFVSKAEYPVPTELTATPEGLGWESLQTLFEDKPKFLDFCEALKQHNMEGLVEKFKSKLISNFLKKVPNFFIETQTAWERLGTTQACLVYGKTIGSSWRPQTEGYLNSRNCLGELRGARLFESPGAARRTLGSAATSLSVVTLVKAQVDIVSIIDDDLSQLDKMPELQETISILEKKRLKEALSKASQEDLIEQIKVLQEKKAEELSENKPKRRL